ncbi:MAG: Obg family GTPase CgtA [Patescibacteria group bacterium]
MLVDDLTIIVAAGNGGKGLSAFNKNKMQLGPSGGSGGHGGSVYVEGVSDLGALTKLRYTKTLKAQDGKNGHQQLNDGTAGEDLTIKVPVGTVVHNLNTKTDAEITAVGQRLLIARGGKGGRGNFHFRGPENTSPTEFEEGRPGEKFRVRFELKLIANVGLIGLPNVGKSSLLNELTKAKSKVANYSFTTLEPHLGSYYGLIIADIPGLIEGASEGKGLGIKFLRHVERTKILFHLISAESEDPVSDYKTIRSELGAYNPALLEKQEYVFVSKSDAVDEDKLKETIGLLKKHNPKVYPLSIIDEASLKKVQTLLNSIAKESQIEES